MDILSFLTHKENIGTFSPKPSRREEYTSLEKDFSRESIQYYYFARVAHQWNIIKNNRPSFEDNMKNYLQRDSYESGWRGFEFSLRHMNTIHVDMFNTTFNHTDIDFFKTITNPVHLQTRINEVSRASSIFRDMYIVKKIKNKLQDKCSVFAQYGYSHVVMQEPMLRGFAN